MKPVLVQLDDDQVDLATSRVKDGLMYIGNQLSNALLEGSHIIADAIRAVDLGVDDRQNETD